MLKWLYYKLIGGCDHQWENVDQFRVTKANTDIYGGETAKSFHRYILRCKHCGNMKTFDAT